MHLDDDARPPRQLENSARRIPRSESNREIRSCRSARPMPRRRPEGGGRHAVPLQRGQFGALNRRSRSGATGRRRGRRQRITAGCQGDPRRHPERLAPPKTRSVTHMNRSPVESCADPRRDGRTRTPTVETLRGRRDVVAPRGPPTGRPVVVRLSRSAARFRGGWMLRSGRSSTVPIRMGCRHLAGNPVEGGHSPRHTGKPAPMASITAMPNVSSREGLTSTSIADSSAGTSERGPVMWTHSSTPSSTARCVRVCRRGPSPTRTSSRRPRSSVGATASSSCGKRLTGSSRPTAPTSSVLAAIPSSLRTRSRAIRRGEGSEVDAVVDDRDRSNGTPQRTSRAGVDVETATVRVASRLSARYRREGPAVSGRFSIESSMRECSVEIPTGTPARRAAGSPQSCPREQVDLHASGRSRRRRAKRARAARRDGARR